MNFIMKHVLLLCLLLLGGCHVKQCGWKQHNEERHKYFMECLTMASQPEHNHEDNNGHLIEACDDAARYQTQTWVCE